MKKEISLHVAAVCWFLVALVSLIVPGEVFAAGTVTVCDEGHLRAALVGGGLVDFAADGTITLTNTLVITNNTTIDASGHSVTISGGNAVRLITVNSNVTAAFLNLTLANGRHAGASGNPGQPGIGGAILNSGGNVQMTGSLLVSNSVAGGDGVGGPGGDALGAAIWSTGGNVMVTNCSFVGNTGVGGIGGTGVPFHFASGHARGGAIGSVGGNFIIQSSTLLSNVITGGEAISDFGFPSSPGQAGSAFGGAVWSLNATGSFFQVTFTGNSAVGRSLASASSGTGGSGSGLGGGIWASNGSISCVGCVFSVNTAQAGSKPRYGVRGVARGGAIWNNASLSVLQSTFSSNHAIGNGAGGDNGGDGSGGAIWTETTLLLSASTFSDNRTKGGDGGTISTVNFSGGIGRGGAVCNVGNLFATNCTFRGNVARGGRAANVSLFPNYAPGGDGDGGGLYNSNGTVTAINLTFTLNEVHGGSGEGPGPDGPPGLSLGGGIFTTNGTLNIGNTIVANSVSGSNCVGTLVDLGHNLSSDSSAGFSGTGSLTNTDPKIGPLDFYGGPTPTFPLLTGSPAIDGGDTALGPSTDQRGHARPYGSASDIGAFESSAPFVIRGRISGSTLLDEVGVSCASTNVTTVNGTYSLEGLAGDSYTVTPGSSDYVFYPTNRSVSVGPDQLGVDFKAYHWNALSIESSEGGVLNLRYAGSNGLAYRVLFATNLSDWIAVSTNVPVSSNLFQILDSSLHSYPAGFYRVVVP